VSSTYVPQHFELNSEYSGETVIVRLAGEFDIACEECFEAALQPFEEQQDSIVVDLSALRFIDSSGLQLLIAAHERARRDGFHLAVVPGEGPARQALELTGLGRVLPIFEDAAATAVRTA
jgi:anti-sigma B factor antagonist